MNSIIDYFERTVEKFSNKKAIIKEEKSATYNDLIDMSMSIGSYLIDKISLTESIAIFMDKDIETLASFLGVVYAGGFYSVVNPELPDIRIKSIVETLECKFIITDDQHYEKAKEVFDNLEILNVRDLLNTKIDQEKINSRKNKIIDTDPLYANFTSGSTGVPKGVLVSHRSVVDFINVFIDDFDFDSEDIIANQAPFDFDVSVKDIYTALFTGATLLIVPKELFSSPAKLVDYLVENNATNLTWAVSALCLLSTFHGLEYKVPTSIKRVLFSGEVMPLKHLNYWFNYLSDARFINLYGPTEITCNCTYYELSKDENYEEGIPIGKEFKNERVYLLDEEDKIITDENKIGEICVVGTCLALGYLNNEMETKKAFINNPNNRRYPEPMYRTGDLGLIKNGLLYFKGRRDFQIKYLGHRIELEEIDKYISDIEGVNRCVSIFDEEKSKLYAFYIGEIESSELHASLSKKVPIYMIPGRIVKIDEFPLTKNGKVDRKNLLGSVKK